MKSKYKISTRERWALAFAPALVIVAVYFFGFLDDLSANVEREQNRVAAAGAPIQQSPASSSVAKAKAAREKAKSDIAERERQIADLEAKIAALPTIDSDRGPSASVIGQVEAVFNRSGITPLTSEPADDGDAAADAPAALLDVLAPKLTGPLAGMKRQARVWHYIFNDKLPNFQSAVKELATATPTVVPLSMNLVYNPTNLGTTRLLELWLLY